MSSVSTSATSLESLVIDPNDPAYAQFANIFAHFTEGRQDAEAAALAGPNKGEVYYSDEEDEDEEARQKAAAKAAEYEGLTRRERRRAAVSHVCESDKAQLIPGRS